MSFTPCVINQVWDKATVVSGYDSNVWRKDACSAWIKKSSYGDQTDKYGWDIDHKKPVSKGGTDDLINLQPLHWKNNLNKGDGPNAPIQYCCVVSSGSSNSENC